jgi:cytochrome c oxidase subunit 4
MAGTHDKHDAHAHGDHHDDGHGHGLAHTASVKVLLGTWGTLMVLTVLTVLVARKIDLGSNGNLAIAMFIATLKATLVVVFFMHLKYDRIFHSVLLVGGILAASLFVGFCLMDREQYGNTVIWDDRTPPEFPMGPRTLPPSALK